MINGNYLVETFLASPLALIVVDITNNRTYNELRTPFTFITANLNK